MKRLKTYKIFESDFYESFDLIEDYINEFCDTFDFDLYSNDTEDKIYLKTNSNGIFVWRLVDNKWEKTDDIKKWYCLIFEIRIRDSFRVPNEDKIKNMINWISERIDNFEISKNGIDLYFISNSPQTWKSKKLIPSKRGLETFTKYEIKFDIIKNPSSNLSKN